MIITLASADDLATIAELAALAGAEVDVAAELARPWASLWVARRGEGQPVSGFLLAWTAADEVHLIDVVTDAQVRRQGVGSALVQELVVHAVGQRARLIALEVRRSNHAALALYRKAGFYASGLRRAYYRDGEDAVLMQLDLDPEAGTVLRRDDEIELP